MTEPRMRRPSLGLILALVLASVEPVAAQGPDLAALEQCMRANLPAAARVQGFRMTTRENGMEQTLAGNLFAATEGEQLLTTIQIDQPPDLAGGAFLLRQQGEREQMHVYIPAARRVRRVQGAGASLPLFGSALRYSDVKQLQNSLGAATLSWVADEELDGVAVHQLAVSLPAEQQPAGTEVRAWVDRASCVLRRATVRRDGTLLREVRIEPAEAADADGRWLVSRAVIEDRETGRITELDLGELSGHAELPDKLFSPTAFYRVR